MSERLKEALTALARMVCKCAGEPFGDCDFVTVRTALESAQCEAAAWEAIEAWGDKTHGHIRYGVGHLITMHRNKSHVAEAAGASRLEAIEAAAKWCRAELAK